MHTDAAAMRAIRTVADADAAAMRAILATELGPLLTHGRVRVFAPQRWWDHDNEELETERLNRSIRREGRCSGAGEDCPDESARNYGREKAEAPSVARPT